MRRLAWVATAAVAAATTACSTATRTRFAATASAVERAADAVPVPAARTTAQRPARVVSSPVVAAPRAISMDETAPSADGSPGSPDAAPLSLASVPLRPVNATCPVMVGMPVDSACTTIWHGCCIAFCDVAARARWEAAPEVFASNLPPTLAAAPIAAPVPGARLVSAPPSAPVAKAAAPAAAKPGPSPLAPVAAKRAAADAPSAHAPAPAGPVDLLGEDEDCECKDGSCRLPLPPR